MEMLKIIVSIAFVAICSYLLCLVNLRKNKRHKQGILPIILTVYSVVMATVMYKNVDKLVEAAEQEAYMQFSHILYTYFLLCQGFFDAFCGFCLQFFYGHFWLLLIE